MADAVLSNPNQRLVSNRFDDVECHNQASEIEIQSSSFKTILRKRRLIIISTLSLILIAITSTILSAVFIVKANQAKTFKLDLESLIDKEFNFLDADSREKYVDELVTLFKKGYVSDDFRLEFETFLEFEAYNAKYSVKHKDEKERRERFTYFRNDYHDIKSRTGKELYTREINNYTDMTDKELRSLFPRITNLPKAKKAEVNPVSKINVELSPDYLNSLKAARGGVEVSDVDKITGEGLDWRKADALTYVKDQGTNSPSDWAISVIDSVESLFKIYNKERSVHLSFQELLNCDFKSEKEGNIVSAFDYVSNGVSSAFGYPYSGVRSRCKNSTSSKKFEIGSKVFMTGKDILNKSLVISPTVVAMSMHREFLSYKGGLYDGPCAKNLNHYVLLVGEGYDEETKSRYWIIKNTFGQSWGENGYARIVRTDEKFDKCDILSVGFNPSFTKVETEEARLEREKQEAESRKRTEKARKEEEKRQREARNNAPKTPLRKTVRKY
uniref:Cysteine proteinase, tacP, putative n=1 Tax=Theileria annulata TaxID=5874 RepID=A0A3B0MRV5_THEAN